MSVRGFWQQYRTDNRDVIRGAGAMGMLSKAYYIAPDGGGPRGAMTFTSFESLKPHLKSRDVIFIVGLLREQAVAPDGVYDVTIIGAANTPRQATDGGVYTGGGATWMPPASGAVAATPLLEIVRQGWSIQNMLFNPHTSSAAVRLTTAGGLDEAGQFSFVGNTILGGGTGQIGIEDNGGSGFVVIEGNLFQLLTGTALLGLSTANAVPLSWNINQNEFSQNTNDIKMSLSRARIQWNNFLTAGSGATNKVIQTNFIAAQGNNNHVCHNVFTNTAAQIANASGYNGGNADVWADNYCTDAVDYGIPA